MAGCLPTTCMAMLGVALWGGRAARTEAECHAQGEGVIVVEG